jgi:hypothetical protein
MEHVHRRTRPRDHKQNARDENGWKKIKDRKEWALAKELERENMKKKGTMKND